MNTSTTAKTSSCLRLLAIPLLGLASASVLAAPAAVPTPPDASGVYRYLPTDKSQPSGLAKGLVPLPDTHTSKNSKASTADKTNHLPVKPVNGKKINTGFYPLVPLQD